MMLGGIVMSEADRDLGQKYSDPKRKRGELPSDLAGRYLPRIDPLGQALKEMEYVDDENLVLGPLMKLWEELGRELRARGITN